MIKDYDDSLLQYSTNCNKEYTNRKENLKVISVMLKTSNKWKSINAQKFMKFLTCLDLNKNIKIYFFGKDYYDIPILKNLNITNLTGKTSNLLDLFEYVKNSQLVITADTSLYHIASDFNIPTIVFVNSKTLKINRHINFWLNNYKNNLIVKNKYFFNNSFINTKKEFSNILLAVKNFIAKN